MRNYATQMEAARKGILTEELKKVAEKEKMTVEELLPLVATGKVAICANKNHKCLDPQGVGSMLRTKINVNLGISDGKSNGGREYGGRRNYGSVFSWGYDRFSQKADRRMSGYDRNRTNL
jgi:thiamine biosynthesis protein ThiC